MQAIWHGAVLADSDEVVELEGGQYFPPQSVKREYFQESDFHTRCPRKGLASYYSVEVDGQVNENAAWYYPEPLEKATHVRDYVAFWRGVEIK